MTTTHELEPGTVTADDRKSTEEPLPVGNAHCRCFASESSAKRSARTGSRCSGSSIQPKPRLMASDAAPATFCGGKKTEPRLPGPGSVPSLAPVFSSGYERARGGPAC